MLKPLEFAQMQEILNRKYAVYLGDRSISLTPSEPEKGQVALETLVASEDRSFFYPIESRIAGVKQGLNSRDAMLLLLDYTDYYLDEYFRSEGEVTLTLGWSEYEFEGYALFMKGQPVNKRLEEEADRLLQDAQPT